MDRKRERERESKRERVLERERKDHGGKIKELKSG
jgi:hypothetical protein